MLIGVIKIRYLFHYGIREGDIAALEYFNILMAFMDVSGKTVENLVIGTWLVSASKIVDAPQVWIDGGRFEREQNHGLIRTHIRGLAHRMGVAPFEQHVGLGAHDKEGRTESKDEEPLKIDVAPIHDIEGSGFGHDLV